jgi:DNA-binding MarR family transcriptional regulator
MAPENHLVPLIVADVYQLAGQLRAHGETIAGTVGQTQARWQVISAASAEPKTVPQIARRLGVTRQNVQRIADLLVAEGSARFATNPDHRSSDHLVLTQPGRDALRQLTLAAEAYHARLAEQFTGTQLTVLHRALRRLCAVLEHAESVAQPPGGRSLRRAKPRDDRGRAKGSRRRSTS